jgi:hypothetical protein
LEEFPLSLKEEEEEGEEYQGALQSVDNQLEGNQVVQVLLPKVVEAEAEQRPKLLPQPPPSKQERTLA